MRKVLEIVVLVALPLGWGLAVEWVFELLRRRRAGCGAASGAGRGRPGRSDRV